MTKLETVQILADPRNVAITMKWSDETIIKIWNTMYQNDSKKYRLIKIGDEFKIESYTPLSDFTKDAIQYFSQNQ